MRNDIFKSTKTIDRNVRTKTVKTKKVENKRKKITILMSYKKIDMFSSIKIEALKPNVPCPLAGEQIPYIAQIHVTYF